MDGCFEQKAADMQKPLHGNGSKTIRNIYVTKSDQTELPMGIAAWILRKCTGENIQGGRSYEMRQTVEQGNHFGSSCTGTHRVFCGL